MDRDDTTLGWTAGRRVIALAGDASDEAATGQAAGLAQDAGTLARWVNNAACLLMPGWTPCPRARPTSSWPT